MPRQDAWGNIAKVVYLNSLRDRPISYVPRHTMGQLEATVNYQKTITAPR